MSAATVESIRESLENIDDEKERIALLRQLSGLLHPNDMQGALCAIEEALRLSIAIGSQPDAARCMIAVADCHRDQGDYAGAEKYFTMAAAALEDLPDASDLHWALASGTGLLHRNRGQYPAALACFGRALEISRGADDRARTADVLSYMSYIYLAVGDNARAVELLTDALAMFDAIGDTAGEAIALNTLGDVCKELEDWQRALDYYRRAYDLAVATGHRLGQGVTLANMATVHLQCLLFDRAREANAAALAIFRELALPQYVTGVLYETGAVCNAGGGYDEALVHLEESLAIAERVGIPRQATLALCGIAESRMMRGELRLAAEYLGRALDGAESLADLRLTQDICQMYVQLHEALQEPAAALRYHKRAAELTGKIRTREAMEAMAKLEMRADIERSERERERYRQEASRLQAETERKSRDLTAMALHLAQKSEMVTKMEDRFRAVDPASCGTPGELLQQLLSYLREHGAGDDQWPQFQQRFSELHPRFVHDLSERYPALTPMEVRICSLMKTGLCTKEVAAILCTSTRTVEGHRRLIRIKLNLSRHENLSTFLAAIG